MTIDEMIDAMPEPRRTKIKRRILALIHEEDSRERADWTGVTKLRKVRMQKRNGVQHS